MLIGNRTYKVAAVTNRKVGYHVRKDRLMWIRFQFVDPLPATGDILTANGFTLCEGCTSAWDWHSGDTSVHISGDHTCPIGQTLTIYVPDGTVGAAFSSHRVISDLKIRGIHELQHALHLCGIKLEIKIKEGEK